MSYNFFDIVLEELTGKAEYVDQQTYVNRVETCLQCPNLTHYIPNIPSCKLCRMLY